MLPFDVLKMVKSTTGGGAGGGSGVLSPLDVDAYAELYRVGTTQATASLSLNSDGTVTVLDSGGPAFWYDPITASIGNTHWALVTITSGSVTTGTVGSRVQLTSGATWTVTTTGTGAVRSKTATGTIQIWDAAAAGTMLASGTFSMTAYVDNS